MDTYLQDVFRTLFILLFAVNLTGCPSPTPEPILPDRPPEALVNGNVLIEVPEYLVADQPNTIKLKLVGQKNYTINGYLSLKEPPLENSQTGITSRINDNRIYLSSENAEVSINYTPTFSASDWDSYKVTIEFKGNDSDSYSLTVNSKSVPVYKKSIDLGSALTVVENSTVPLGIKTNRLLEQQIGTFTQFEWQQKEGPIVQINQIEDKQYSFTAPAAETLTKLRFELTASTLNNSSKTVAEKIVYIAPSNMWAKVVKTSSEGYVVLRDDNSIVVAGHLPYTLNRGHDEVKTIESYFSVNGERILILYKDGTIDAIGFDSSGEMHLINTSLSRKPIQDTTQSVFYEADLFLANNIKQIWANRFNIIIQTVADKLFSYDYELVGFYSVDSASRFELTADHVLKGNLHIPDVGTRPVSLENIAAYRLSQSFDELGYIRLDNQVGVIKAASVAMETNPENLVQDDIFGKSPYQLSPFVDIFGSGFRGEYFTLEENGHVNSFYKGIWQDYPFLRDIAQLKENFVITKSGSVIYHRHFPTYHPLIDYANGKVPSPFNLKSLPVVP